MTISQNGLTLKIDAVAFGVPLPLTTAGDLVFRNGSGVNARLPVGSNGQALKVVGGLPAWSSDVGFADPMTTAGDLIFRNGSNATARLPAGSNGKILTVVAGVPTWSDPPSVDPLNPVDGILNVNGATHVDNTVAGLANVVLRARGAVGQTGNLLDLQDSAGASKLHVAPSGVLSVDQIQALAALGPLVLANDDGDEIVRFDRSPSNIDGHAKFSGFGFIRGGDGVTGGMTVASSAEFRNYIDLYNTVGDGTDIVTSDNAIRVWAGGYNQPGRTLFTKELVSFETTDGIATGGARPLAGGDGNLRFFSKDGTKQIIDVGADADNTYAGVLNVTEIDLSFDTTAADPFGRVLMEAGSGRFIGNSTNPAATEEAQVLASGGTDARISYAKGGISSLWRAAGFGAVCGLTGVVNENAFGSQLDLRQGTSAWFARDAGGTDTARISLDAATGLAKVQSFYFDGNGDISVDPGLNYGFFSQTAGPFTANGTVEMYWEGITSIRLSETGVALRSNVPDGSGPSHLIESGPVYATVGHKLLSLYNGIKGGGGTEVLSVEVWSAGVALTTRDIQGPAGDIIEVFSQDGNSAYLTNWQGSGVEVLDTPVSADLAVLSFQPAAFSFSLPNAGGVKARISGAGLSLPTAGEGILIKEGADATLGVATLVGGTVTVLTAKVTASSRIFVTVQALGGIAAPVGVAVTARVAGTSFTITSASELDTSTVAWEIVEPA